MLNKKFTFYIISKLTRRPERPYTFTLVTNYDLNKNLLLQTRADNQVHQKEGCWREIFHLLIERRKATGVMSL